MKARDAIAGNRQVLRIHAAGDDVEAGAARGDVAGQEIPFDDSSHRLVDLQRDDDAGEMEDVADRSHAHLSTCAVATNAHGGLPSRVGKVERIAEQSDVGKSRTVALDEDPLAG